MDTFDTVCNHKIKLGGKYLSKCHVMDGQKFICMDEVMKDIQKQECIVYSFGIGGDWSFEDNISEMGCKVFAYDPTISHPSQRSENIFFRNIGVVGQPNDEKNYLTLNEIFKTNGHEDTMISYMKVDIESHELSGLPNWLKSDILKNVKQLAIEVHLEPPDDKLTSEFFKTFQELHLKGHYRIFNWEANNCWKNLNKQYNYFGLSEIALIKINHENTCAK